MVMKGIFLVTHYTNAMFNYLGLMVHFLEQLKLMVKSLAKML